MIGDYCPIRDGDCVERCTFYKADRECTLNHAAYLIHAILGEILDAAVDGGPVTMPPIPTVTTSRKHRIATCNACGEQYDWDHGSGGGFIRTKGTKRFFCSSECMEKLVSERPE